MKRQISIYLVAIMSLVICTGTFVSCASNNSHTNDSWFVDWDKYQPDLDYDTNLPEQDDEQDGQDNGQSQDQEENGSQDDDQVEETPQPTVSYSYLIRSNTNNLTIRSSPSTSGSVMGYMDKDDMLSYEGLYGNWYKTVYKQKTAYVYAGNNYAYIVKMEQTSPEIENVIDVGKQLLGYPYVWGSQRYHWGNGKLNANFVQGQFDCSALMQYIYYVGAGVLLDVNTRTQVVQGRTVADGDLQRGDLMFFTNSSRYNLTGVERVGHVALYLGDNYILHTASDHAVIEQISATRWSYFIVAKRFL